MTLEELAQDHPYYACESHETQWDCWSDFYEEFKDEEEDLNLCWRWDIRKSEEDDDIGVPGEWYMELFIVHQRKGWYVSHIVKTLTEKDVPHIEEYLRRHWMKLRGLWEPVSC